MRPAILATLAFITSCGCVHTAVVKSWSPAEVPVDGMNRVVVMGFEGERGPSVSNSLAENLWANRFYRVVDRTVLAPQVLPASFDESSSAAREEILLAARTHGIDGIIVGEVLEYRCLAPESVPPIAEAATADADSRRVLNLRAREAAPVKARVSIAFRLIDVHNGEIVAARTVTRELEQPAEAEIDSDALLEDLSRQCVQEIVTMLAPHETTASMALARGDVWRFSRREVREGAVLAEQGNWDAAEEKWLAALERNPREHAALYNLAVSAAQRHDYVRAEVLAMQALELQHRDCYARGLETIRAHRRGFQKSENQRDERVVPASAVSWQ